MSFTVVYDACVLYPAPIRDLLIRLATTGLFRAKWTEEILNECFDALRENRKDIPEERLTRTRELMGEAIRDVAVVGYEKLIDAVELPDPDDRHVVAAAIRAGAQVIVTANLKDFPKDSLSEFDIEAQHPDEFVVNLIDINQHSVLDTVQRQAAALKKPPVTLDELLETLDDNGLQQTVALLRGML